MDFTKTGVVIKSQTTKDFEKLVTDLNNFGLERTVENWNICRANAKLIYDSEVIWMLDASGFIIKWLKG